MRAASPTVTRCQHSAQDQVAQFVEVGVIKVMASMASLLYLMMADILAWLLIFIFSGFQPISSASISTAFGNRILFSRWIC